MSADHGDALMILAGFRRETGVSRWEGSQISVRMFPLSLGTIPPFGKANGEGREKSEWEMPLRGVRGDPYA